MFPKLFSSKKPNDGSQENGQKKNAPHRLDQEKIRLVILADSEKGRTPFFDSDAICLAEDVDKLSTTKKKVSSLLRSSPKDVSSKTAGASSPSHCNSPSKEGSKFKFKKLGSEVKVLEEMMFGTVPMAYKGQSLKIHLMRAPQKLMITKVFVPEKPRGESISEVESDSLSLVNSMMDFSSGESFSITKYKEAGNKSRPMDVPASELSDYGTDEDNGFPSFTSSGSFPSFPSPSSSSLSSYSSLHKRWMRSQTTTFNSVHKKAMLESSVSSEGSTKRVKRYKLAVGILFGPFDEKDDVALNLFQSFVFSHFTLIEAHVKQLQTVIEKAYFNLKTFLHVTMEALNVFRQDFYNLYMAPRLTEPVWLSMMSSSVFRLQICENFMKEFNSLVTHFDKKDHKFFVSTLLSAVLTQHLTWVATVTPADGTPTPTYLEKHSAQWVDTLAKSHPYNPLWAQLGDLFGATGPPFKISRIVVTGKKADVVKRFLYILSYFIRCSDIHKQEHPCSIRRVLSNSSSEEPQSPTPSEKTLMNGSSVDDKFSVKSLSCSHQTSCGSSGAGVFVGSQGCEAFPLTQTLRSAESVGDQGSLVGGEVTQAPSVVYCDSSTKSVFQCESENVYDMSKKDNVIEEKKAKSLHSGPVSPENNTDPVNIDKQELVKTSCSDDNHSLPIQNLTSLETGKFSDSPCAESLERKLYPSVLESLDSLSLTPSKGAHPISSVDSSLLYNSTAVPLSLPDNFDNVVEKNVGISELHTYAPPSIARCNLAPLNVSVPLVENVNLVKRSADPFHIQDEFKQRSMSLSESKQTKSKLSQQLEGESNSKESCKPTTHELRKLYQAGGTSSMFDEYFKSEAGQKSAGDVTEEGYAHSISSKEETAGNEVKSPVTRMLSFQENKVASKGRPVTPDLNRRRHLSSTSSIDYDAYDPLTHAREVKLPMIFSDGGQYSVQHFDKNFGRSLLAGFSEKYMSDFVLLGTSEKNFKDKLLKDLQTSVQSDFLDERIEEAVCVIADTDSWTVELASSKILKTSPSGCTMWSYSKLVADMIESVIGLYKLKMGAEFCLMHLEDRLQEIYFKSFMLAEYLQDPSKFNQQELTSMLGFENSDLSLLFAVAGTHTPSLLTRS